MARALLMMSSDLESAFADAQSGRVRLVKAKIEGETFALAGSVPATSDPQADCARLTSGAGPCTLHADEAAFVLLCLDVNVAALRWVLLAFVPEDANVRDKMLYSSARESLKKQLGMNYFVGEFHATELADVTWENFQNAKKKQAADAPLSEAERLLKETALLERDTNVKSSAMGVIPFAISQNLREKLALFRDGKFDWIAMKLSADDESVESSKSLERVDLLDAPEVVEQRTPSFVAFRCHHDGSADATLVFLYVCPEDAAVRLKMVYSTCKATVLAAASELGIEFEKTVEVNSPQSIVEDIRSELAPPKTEEELRPKEFSRPAAPGRGRGRARGRGRGPPSMPLA